MAARSRLPAEVFDFFDKGALDSVTATGNSAGFERWCFAKKTLVDVSHVDMTTTVLGLEVSLPVLTAPIGHLVLIDDNADVAAAEAAAAIGTLHSVSMDCSTPLERIAETGCRWAQQVFFHTDRNVTTDLVKRCIELGCSAIIVTVDLPVIGYRYGDRRHKFSIPVEPANLPKPPGWKPGDGALPFIDRMLDPSASWTDLEQLRKIVSVPLAVKGITSPDDARRAVSVGADAIIVSNHGGRHLDGDIPSVAALPSIVDAVGDRAEVLLDGGVRHGAHVTKALALGARATMIGLPVTWALAAGGTKGLVQYYQMLAETLRRTMMLAGAPGTHNLRELIMELFPKSSS